MRKLLIATNNPGKLREFRALLAHTPFVLVSPRDEGIAITVEETGPTLEENARLKAVSYATQSGLLTLAEDSGLEIDALGGEPGVRSARYGIPGLSDDDRVKLVLNRMAGVPTARRSARFRSVLALATPQGLVQTTQGTVDGRITFAPRGEGGFGYDPIFELPDRRMTMAEVREDEKNGISHRSRAVRSMLPLLLEIAGTPTPVDLTHFDESGRARMVDVTPKSDTERVAIARGRVVMRPETLQRIREGRMEKGDVLAVAQVAGVMGAKHTPLLLPMCHPLLITSVTIDYQFDPPGTLEIEATVKTTGKTGVEMEALTAVSVCALTVYDMCKAADRGMRIGDVRLVHKAGGKSGTIRLE